MFPPEDEPNSRTLKIEADGDYWKGGVKAKIRLCGQWLERAGFKPGHRVRITPLGHGELKLQFLELPEETNEPF